jgi:hypothetical protein
MMTMMNWWVAMPAGQSPSTLTLETRSAVAMAKAKAMTELNECFGMLMRCAFGWPSYTRHIDRTRAAETLAE